MPTPIVLSVPPENSPLQAASGNDVAGPAFPVLPITSAVTLERCHNFKPAPQDVFVCSYPKSGTTWTQNIVFTLATAGKRPLEHISLYAPFYEIDSTWDDETGDIRAEVSANHTAIGRRIFNTHLWPDMLPPTGGKLIYLIRDGRDVVTSFFHHLSHQTVEDGGFEGDFEDFFNQWMRGEIAFGRWSDHVVRWRTAAASDPRILLLSYEDMKTDLASCVARINAHCGFGLDDQKLSELLPRFSFESMKADISKFSPRSVKMIDKGDGFAFIRKGQVGDHKALFTAEQSRRFNEMLADAFPDGDWRHGIQ